MLVHKEIKNNPGIFSLKNPVNRPAGEAKVKSDKKFGLKENHSILCKNCGNPITTPESIISVNEKHEHILTNPTGAVYQVGCFSSAEGCDVSGDSTSEDTWFAGFSWNYATCSECMIHLGWFYQGKDVSFFGLIVDLLESSENSF